MHYARIRLGRNSRREEAEVYEYNRGEVECLGEVWRRDDEGKRVVWERVVNVRGEVRSVNGKGNGKGKGNRK
jgi:hypothetical protein